MQALKNPPLCSSTVEKERGGEMKNKEEGKSWRKKSKS
jgi:hypothetical protein